MLCVPQRIPSGNTREGKTLSKINCEFTDDEDDDDEEEDHGNAIVTVTCVVFS